MKYIGLDLGSKTLGVSLSDNTGIIASAYDVLRYEDYDSLLNMLSIIIDKNKVNSIVLGYPLNMSGTESTRSKETLVFKKMLEEKFSMEVILQDERMSTIEAERMLIKNSTRREKRKKVIDKLAATIILQAYLDRK